MSQILKVLSAGLRAWYIKEVGEEPSKRRYAAPAVTYKTLNPLRELLKTESPFERDTLFSLDLEDFL